MNFLGPMHAASFQVDPKHLAFVLARYHFAARMLQDCDTILEVGCGDGTGARLLMQNCEHYLGVDRDKDILPPGPNFLRCDMTTPVYVMKLPQRAFKGVVALDVLEHVPPDEEDRFLRNIKSEMMDGGTFVCGSPSLESQPYASELSKLHHVNCKTEQQFRETLRRHFGKVFVFGMTDTTLHTGFGPMTHYRLAVCVK